MRVLDELSPAAFERLAQTGDRVPVWRELAVDRCTPVSLFRRLRAPSHSFLFESLGEGGRFAWLGDEPSALLRVFGGVAVLEEQGRRTFFDEPSPYGALRRLLGRSIPAREPRLPPLAGGLFGWLGWAAVGWSQPGATVRPDEVFPDAEWMVAERVAVFDRREERLFVVASVELAAHRTARAARAAGLSRLDELQAAFEADEPPEGPVPRLQRLSAERSDTELRAAIEQARAALTAEPSSELSLAAAERGRWEDDPFEVYRALRARAPSGRLGYLCFGDHALVHAAPAPLLTVAEGRLRATEVADGAVESSARHDTLARRQTSLQVSLSAAVAPESVRTSEAPWPLQGPRTNALAARFEGALAEHADSLDALAAWLPGPALGSPRALALQLVNALEPAPRGPFGGAAGVIGWDGALELAPLTRVLSLAGDQLRLQGAATVTAQVDPDAVLAALEVELGALRTALGVASAGARRRARP